MLAPLLEVLEAAAADEDAEAAAASAVTKNQYDMGQITVQNFTYQCCCSSQT